MAILGSSWMRMLCWQMFWQHATTRSPRTYKVLDRVWEADWALLGLFWVPLDNCVLKASTECMHPKTPQAKQQQAHPITDGNAQLRK